MKQRERGAGVAISVCLSLFLGLISVVFLSLYLLCLCRCSIQISRTMGAKSSMVVDMGGRSKYPDLISVMLVSIKDSHTDIRAKGKCLQLRYPTVCTLEVLKIRLHSTACLIWCLLWLCFGRAKGFCGFVSVFSALACKLLPVETWRIWQLLAMIYRISFCTHCMDALRRPRVKVRESQICVLGSHPKYHASVTAPWRSAEQIADRPPSLLMLTNSPLITDYFLFLIDD